MVPAEPLKIPPHVGQTFVAEHVSVIVFFLGFFECVKQSSEPEHRRGSLDKPLGIFRHGQVVLTTRSKDLRVTSKLVRLDPKFPA